jgi:hypothetical protein
MTLLAAASVRLGSSVFGTHAAAVTVTLADLPGVSRFEVSFPAPVAVEASAGDPGSLELDGGEGAETVLTGKIRGFRRDVGATQVLVADASADLAAYRPATTYDSRDAKAVIEALARDAQADVRSVDLDVALPAYAAHQRRTAAEHVAFLAGLGGAVAGVGSDGALAVRRPAATPDLALRYGRELLEYEVREVPGAPGRRVLVGSGPAGSADAPDALRESKDPLPGDAPKPGADARWTPTLVLRTPAAASTASQSADARAAAAASTVRARCILVPLLRPGLVVEIQDAPDRLSGGPWLLTSVVHRIDLDGGATTTFVGRGAGGSGTAGGLLQSALSLAGGL